MGTRVLLVGQVSWPGSIESSYLAAFQALGGKVVVFDTVREAYLSVPRRWVLRDGAVDRVRIRLVRLLNHARWDRRLAKKTGHGLVRGVDLVLVFKSPWLRAGTLADMKQSLAGPVFHFNPDSPFDGGNTALNLVRCIPLYDCHFTWSRSLLPQLLAAGGQKVEYLPFAWDPELHPAIVPAGEDRGSALGSDLCFVGAWTADRERWLEPVADLGLAIWGDLGWSRLRRGSPLDKCWRRKRLVGEEFSLACCASKVNLNFLRAQNKTSHNMRTFEVPGAGGFLMTERSAEQAEFFPEDVQMACFATPDELREKVAEYLPRTSRSDMASKAHATVAGEHTYAHRASTVLSVYDGMRR